MANESIRLPSDSTVASQKVHRGSSAPETPPLPSIPKTIAHPIPLATVVLQSKALIEGQKGALFELVLQNDPKSAPSIRIHADTLIQPGTSLLLGIDEEQNYQVIEKPTPDQLKRLVQLELEFWRAHLIPKAGERVFPNLPSTEVLQTLVKQEPDLVPLIKWLTHRSASVNSQQIQQWIREFTPLSSTKPWQPLTENLTFHFSNESKTLPSGHSNTAVSAAEQFAQATTSRQPVIDIRLQQPVGLVTNLLPPVRSIQSFLSNFSHLSKLSQPALTFRGQVFQIEPKEASLVNARAIHFSYLPVRENRIAVPVPTQTGQPHPVNSVPLTVAPPEVQTNALPTLKINQGGVQVSPATSSAEVTVPPAINNQRPAATSTNTKTEMSTNSPESSPAGIKPSSVAPNTLQPLLSPPKTVEGRTPVSIKPTEPMEVRLSQWLNVIDTLIAQSPAHLQAQLKAKAKDLLDQFPASHLTTPAADSADSKQTASQIKDEETSLLTLRNWLDATQARIQHNAIQTALHQWNQPDIPVQQMQLPLIWLGLTHWADIEWWPEKTEKKKDKNGKEKSRQQWRLKIYLTLSPLSPVCADIHWSDDSTQVTFWSEDRSTLGHLNNLLPNLEAWTEGLGERQLTTKHGMPKKASQSNLKSNTQHLVDIRT